MKTRSILLATTLGVGLSAQTRTGSMTLGPRNRWAGAQNTYSATGEVGTTTANSTVSAVLRASLLSLTVRGERYRFVDPRRLLKPLVAAGAMGSVLVVANLENLALALAFVRAADGHADPRWWPEGVAPDAARAAQLAGVQVHSVVIGDTRAERSAHRRTQSKHQCDGGAHDEYKTHQKAKKISAHCRAPRSNVSVRRCRPRSIVRARRNA